MSCQDTSVVDIGAESTKRLEDLIVKIAMTFGNLQHQLLRVADFAHQICRPYRAPLKQTTPTNISHKISRDSEIHRIPPFPFNYEISDSEQNILDITPCQLSPQTWLRGGTSHYDKGTILHRSDVLGKQIRVFTRREIAVAAVFNDQRDFRERVPDYPTEERKVHWIVPVRVKYDAYICVRNVEGFPAVAHGGCVYLEGLQGRSAIGMVVSSTMRKEHGRQRLITYDFGGLYCHLWWHPVTELDV